MEKLNNLIERVKNLKNIEYIFLSLILLFAFLLRLYKIDNPVADWHSFRQADTASVSRIYKEEGIDLLYPRYHDISTTQSGLFNPQGYRFVEFPVFNALHAVFAVAYPVFDLEVWGRLVSILSVLLSSVFIYLLGKRFVDKWMGLLAAFFFAALPFNIYFTRVILPEPLATTLALAGLWFFVRYDDSEKNVSLIFSSLFYSLAFLVKPFTLFFAAPPLFMAIKRHGWKGVLKKKSYWFFAIIIILPLLLWRSWMGQYPEGIPFWKWTLNGDGIRFKPSFWKWIFGERLTKLILGYWGIIPFAFGLINYKKKVSFFFYFLLGMFLYVSTFATANVRHDYYQTIVVPAVVLMLSYGVVSMWKAEFGKKWLTRGLLVFSLLLMFVSAFTEVKEFYKINRPEIILAGNRADEVLPKDAMIIAPYNGDTAFLYQTRRRGWPVVDRPIDELIEKGAQYFVSVNLHDHQTVEFGERFKTIEKADQYVILNLREEAEE